MKIKMKKSFASIFLLFLISALNLINVNKAGVSSVTGHEVSTINDYHSLNGDTSNIEEIDELNKLSATPNDETQNLLIVDQQKMNRIKIMSKRSSQSASDGDICKDYIHFYCDCDYPDPGTARHVQCSIFNTTGLTSNSSEWNNFWTQPNIESLTIDCRGTSGGLNYLPLVAFNYISNKIKAINLIYFNIGTIYSYSFNNIHTIESIILDDNNITEIEDYSFFNLPNLTKLSLARNNLDVVKDGIFHNLANLKELDISGSRLNKIEDKSLNNLQSLTILTLKNNNISTLSQFTFKNLVKLEDLDLAYNSLTLIVNDMFADCANLKYIDLQSNQIEQIEGNAFRGLKLLVTLNLSRNKLKYVPSDVTLIQSNVISYVSLAENQIEKLDPNFIDSIHNKDQLHFLFDFKGMNTYFICHIFISHYHMYAIHQLPVLYLFILALISGFHNFNIRFFD